MASISVQNITVEFTVWYGDQRSLRRSLLSAGAGGFLSKTKSKGQIIVTALRDLSFELRTGDRIALVGPNGSGKTTLLRVLAGIYEPQSGDVEVKGRVAPLFDLTVGMEPDATGMENILIRAIHLGIRRADVIRKLDDIRAFSQLGDYLSLPVKTYSAGMLLRLSLAVSTCFEPDVLLLDEWLDAGDATFLERANRRLEQFVARSSVLVLASHSQEMLKAWCNKAILLNHGSMVAFGSVDEVIRRYRSDPMFLG